MALKEYRRKRRFAITPEPAGARGRSMQKKLIFVVHEHHARRLHWDLRLEWEGVLKSWAVPNEPSTKPLERRLAIETEDHPLEYAKFRGKIPEGEYGAGTVAIWDHGTYSANHDVGEALERGALKITLHGRKLRGDFVLVRTDHEGSGPKSRWLFFKAKPHITGLKVPELKKAA